MSLSVGRGSDRDGTGDERVEISDTMPIHERDTSTEQ